MNTQRPWPETHCVCTALKRADRAISRAYDDGLRPAGLGVTQYSLLSLISRAPGHLTVGDLARAQVMDRTTLSRALAPLQRDGLVQISTGEDRRTRLVSLSPSGQERLEAARPLWRATQDEIGSLVGDERLDHLMTELADLVSRVR
jgi:DNA-binding MarR family transcriptional regulator